MFDHRTTLLLLGLLFVGSNLWQSLGKQALKRQLNTPRMIYVRPAPAFNCFMASYDPTGLFGRAGKTPAEAVGELIVSDPGYIRIVVDIQDSGVKS